MLDIGLHDVFERRYMMKFRELASEFGEFVAYERDRGARDIGIHLTKPSATNGERLTTALCWFQLKGLHESTLPVTAYVESDSIKLSLKVKHLRYWFLQPMPTYLVLYVECADVFLIQNIQKYVATHWGVSVLEMAQESVTVEFSKGSVLDRQAFSLILAENDIKAWSQAFGKDQRSFEHCHRDYALIWQMGTADSRKSHHRVQFVDWITKTRSQLYIQESMDGKNWETIREHWQYMLSIDGLEDVYPYIEFFSLPDHFECYDEEDSATVEFANGDIVYGEDCAGEYYLFVFGAKLNALGSELFETVELLKRTGLLEIEQSDGDMISIAPWHGRKV